MAKKTALILAGAVAKGAFGAGVLATLSKHTAEIPIANIVATSAGALNGAVFATGVRAGRALDVSERLADLWQNDANWHNVIRVRVGDIVSGRGIGDAERLVPIMSRAMADLPDQSASLRPVTLGLVVATLNGRLGKPIEGHPATTFEQTVDFKDADFDTTNGRDRVIRTALGSAAFPILFAPVDVPGVGPCIDGGAVNNTPVKRIIEANANVERIIVVTTEPLVTHPKPDARGVELIGQILEILINERLYRDLHDADSVNEYLEAIDKLQSKPGFTSLMINEVKEIFGWSHREIIQIRPLTPLEGSSFSALSHPEMMKAYVDAGRAAATAFLNSMTPSVPT
ncbi:MAG TPA: patatin-like phospholipase family protein [Polyangiaceae bacterium]|nr:patatin-like phospholipase family protein [Polyangiaceae bacterium]